MFLFCIGQSDDRPVKCYQRFAGLFLFIIIFSLYSKKLNPKLNDYIDFLVKDEIYKKVIKSNNFITNEEVNDILYIDKNKFKY